MVVVVVYLVSNKSCLTLANPWTVACQAPLSLGFPRQEYWSGLLFCLQEIFPIQGSNLCLLHWQVDFLIAESPGKPHTEDGDV